MLPMKAVSLKCLMVFLCVSSSALAGWTKQGEAGASFKAVGPAGFKIVGLAKSLEVTDDGKSLTVSLKLSDIDSDNSLRDRHMLEDLEATKFPSCSLAVPLDVLKEGAADAEGKGTFSIHGKSKDIPFKYTAKCSAGVCDIEGSAAVNLKDYDVKIRSYLGITVKPDITVSAKFQVKK
jgi:polyisoprenoid-binding protein YceI